MTFVELTHPRATPSPVLVEVPHSGLQVPPAVESEIDATPLAMLRDSDIYVDQLYRRAPEKGATLLVSRVSRYVVDLNRGPDEVDSAAVPRHPKARHIPARGVVWRARTDGTPLLRAPLTVEQFTRRLELYYQPYHRTLRDVAAQIREQHGQVVILAAHSMPSAGRRMLGRGEVRRADVVIGMGVQARQAQPGSALCHPSGLQHAEVEGGPSAGQSPRQGAAVGRAEPTRGKGGMTQQCFRVVGARHIGDGGT